LFGEVVESYRVEGGFGDAFGAVVDGGLADESGEGSDAVGGALVEVGACRGIVATLFVRHYGPVLGQDAGMSAARPEA